MHPLRELSGEFHQARLQSQWHALSDCARLAKPTGAFAGSAFLGRGRAGFGESAALLCHFLGAAFRLLFGCSGGYNSLIH
jgi:hypothetical protein